MIEDLFRPHLRTFEPYRSARSETQQGAIFLDANELPFSGAVRFDPVELNRYPDPYQTALRAALAKRLALGIDKLFVGSGSDEAIDLLIRLFCEPGEDTIAALDPTYGVYAVAASVSNVGVTSIPLDERWQLDIETTLETVSSSTKLLFCCSPNNPTGNLLNRGDIITLCRKFGGVVVVDEAYIEFAEGAESLAKETANFENLIVLRTLSKAWGLAGVRLGYCIAHPTVISFLLRIKAPYNVNAVTQNLALQAVMQEEYMRESVLRIIGERRRLVAELQQLSVVDTVYPSDANFVLVKFHDAAAFERLRRCGIIVRRRSDARLMNCLRITVGTPEENMLLIATLKELE